jgi:hypothetical protein
MESWVRNAIRNCAYRDGWIAARGEALRIAKELGDEKVAGRIFDLIPPIKYPEDKN